MSDDAQWLSTDFWHGLMGRELPASPVKALQPVMVEDGRLCCSAGHVRHRFEPGSRVAFRSEGGRVVLAEAEDGVEVEDNWRKLYEFELSADARALLPDDDPLPCMLVGDDGQMGLMPVRVAEHPADVLGPRIVDEVDASDDSPVLVRHLVRGYRLEEWTPERLEELAAIVCAEALPRDPVSVLAEGGDWVAWKTRREILGQPATGDGELRRTLEGETFARQGADGSWDESPLKTAYGVLRALSLGVGPDDPRLERAAGWLLDQPEPVGRPGMWVLDDELRDRWDAAVSGEGRDDGGTLREAVGEAVVRWTRQDPQQQVVPICARHYGGFCDPMLSVSGTVADALCRCRHGDHSRVREYAAAMLRMGGYFGYFCSCWGILKPEHAVEVERGARPDFDDPDNAPEGILDTLPDGATCHSVALDALPYGYARDADDLLALASNPNYDRVHRPWLADTNGWAPYDWRDLGQEGRYALVGSYWQNADCWAKANRGLCGLPGWPGSVAAFMGLFQCHLYQTALGAWDQGFPAGMLRQIADMTRLARSGPGEASELRLARVMVLKTIPWLRRHQKEDGLWDHGELHCERGYDEWPCISPRLATYHVCDVLNEFGLLDRLRGSQAS